MLNMINFVKPDLRKDQVAFVEQLKADAVKYESEVSRILIRNVKTRDAKANGVRGNTSRLVMMIGLNLRSEGLKILSALSAIRKGM